ncbi:hypothetical protein CHS0354_008386 [Potamilus streckersoni]|uniref:Uncharacterized protein n=1 Tax=Potamilus streckersoni TaxID=2493646 RepID=A0AAE0RPM0_9BIVA|nr:hypothetical protein CHS0354_008386 [Potamilus streckersoni]
MDEGSKLQRRVDYLKRQLLHKLRINDGEITTKTNLSQCLSEIDYRQGKSRGISRVRDDVSMFFGKLNNHIHYYLDVNDEIFTGLLIDLYEMVTSHFFKIAFVDVLKALKESIPKKKEAFQPKLQYQNESRTLKRKWAISKLFQCNICKGDNPQISQENNIACVICNLRLHFGCFGLTGNEKLIKRKNSV